MKVKVFRRMHSSFLNSVHVAFDIISRSAFNDCVEASDTSLMQPWMKIDNVIFTRGSIFLQYFSGVTLYDIF